jgi:Family of unknown function (DUF5990)
MAGGETPTEVQFRLIRNGDAPPTNPLGDAFVFGLQDTGQQLHPAVRDAAGRFVFDFSLAVKPGRDGRPNFTGAFASGPATDRFVYLSWLSVPRGVWINRIKARLADIDWALIERAQGRRLAADLSGWSPGGGRRAVDWRVE